MMPPSRDRAGRRVGVSADGSVWLLYAAELTYRLDWAALAALPDFVIRAGQAYAAKMIVQAAPITARDVVGLGLKGLLRCASVHKALDRLDESTFAEFRLVVPTRLAAQHFRKFYRWAAVNEFEGFDVCAAEVMDGIEIGAARVPDPTTGRCPALSKQDQAWLIGAMNRAPASVLALNERNALEIALLIGPNPGPLGLVRDVDHVESGGRDELRIPRHKKGLPHERSGFRKLRVGRKLAERIRTLVAENTASAAAMHWPDGTVGRPPGVGLPLLMRKKPRPSQADTGCPTREYALHLKSSEVSALLDRAVKKLCVFDDRPVFRVCGRVLRRTVLQAMREDGESDAAVARAADHGDTSHVARYAGGGMLVVAHLDRKMGSCMAEICDPFETKRAIVSEGDATQLLRKTTFRRRTSHAVRERRERLAAQAPADRGGAGHAG
jgi:hypothetical protein